MLIAPPGAGKTTAVAPALLDEPWCTGEILVLAPRRVAARAAAERMAELAGEPAGQTFGYTTRLDSKPGKRVTVMTEAIFVARILADPELSSVSAVLFDEVHERHLDSDLGLALAIESAGVLREDLRIVAMSATLDGARFADILGGAPVVESEGRAWPLEIRWLGARPELRLPDAMTAAILAAWREEPEGDLLAFLPGVADISRTADLLAARLPGVPILPLHGQIEPAAQRAAIRRDPEGRRRIVLATSIAETSLTLDGVRIVVDAGLSRRAEFDPSAGVTRLATRNASRASAAQRAGRAARQGPGIAYRMWEEGGHQGRAAFEPPEILVADLAPLVLTLVQWGAGDPAALAWLDPPPTAAMAVARASLTALGALDASGRITPHGRAMAQLPLEPALAHMVLFAARNGMAEEGAALALLVQERGLGGRGDDLALRYDRWCGDRSPRAQASRQLALRWARQASRLVNDVSDKHVPLAALLAEGLPDRIARRRDASGETWLAASGRGYRLDPTSPLACGEWMVIADAQGEAKGARITAGIALDRADLLTHLGHRIEERARIDWNAPHERAEPVRERRIGAIAISRGPDSSADKNAIAARLLDQFRTAGLLALPLGESAERLLKRANFAGLESLSAEALIANADDWLRPLIGKATSLRDLAPARIAEALQARLGWDGKQTLDRLAPPAFTSPAGSGHTIDYTDPGGPSVEVRVQALFGLDRHPTFGQPPQPLLLKLTSPAGRPIQTTRDLPQFWRGSWRDVQREMKGRYPRHRWPDRPWEEDPSLKTRNAFEASRRT